MYAVVPSVLERERLCVVCVGGAKGARIIHVLFNNNLIHRIE